MICLVVRGAPRTKKNHSQIVRAGGRPRLIPSLQYRKWHAKAVPQLRSGWAGREAINRPIGVCALFYRDANRGDAVGYFQALADALQDAGVVADDKWIVNWDGSRIFKDADNPRIEIEITEAT